MNILNIFKSEQQIIKQIHGDFDSAQDRLLLEAKELLSSLNLDSETGLESMADRLKAIGFDNSELVKKVETIKKKREKQQSKIVTTQKQAEIIEYNKFHYPMLKFLTIKELDRICNKYGLIYAQSTAYIKDVPEKNILDIERVQPLKREDYPDTIITHKYKIYNWPSSFHLWYLNPSDIPIRFRHSIKIGIPHGSDSSLSRVGLADVIKRASLITEDRRSIDFEDSFSSKDDRMGLFIAAPKSHFNLKGLSNDGLGFFKTNWIKNDPIVFRYVKGGVQVITKWGLEAEEPELFVDKMN